MLSASNLQTPRQIGKIGFGEPESIPTRPKEIPRKTINRIDILTKGTYILCYFLWTRGIRNKMRVLQPIPTIMVIIPHKLDGQY